MLHTHEHVAICAEKPQPPRRNDLETTNRFQTPQKAALLVHEWLIAHHHRCAGFRNREAFTGQNETAEKPIARPIAVDAFIRTKRKRGIRACDDSLSTDLHDAPIAVQKGCWVSSAAGQPAIAYHHCRGFRVWHTRHCIGTHLVGDRQRERPAIDHRRVSIDGIRCRGQWCWFNLERFTGQCTKSNSLVRNFDLPTWLVAANCQTRSLCRAGRDETQQ